MATQTKRFYTQADASGRVTRATLTANEMTAPWIDTGLDHWAEPTEQKDGYDAVMYWDGKAIAWHYEPSVPMPEPEPIPEEPAPPTAEDLAELRRQAYEAEADRYLIAMHGYEVEGNTAAAENCKRAYLAKKLEIRTRISGSVSELVQNVTETPASEPESVQIPLSGDDDLL